MRRTKSIFFLAELISTSGPSHAPQFVIKASLNDMSFEGSGKSKKDAKLNASKALLVHLHKVGFDPMTGDMMSTQQNNAEVADGHSFADKIGQLGKFWSDFGRIFGIFRQILVRFRSDFGQILVRFLAFSVRFWSDFGLISIRFRSDFGLISV